MIFIKKKKKKKKKEGKPTWHGEQEIPTQTTNSDKKVKNQKCKYVSYKTKRQYNTPWNKQAHYNKW